MARHDVSGTVVYQNGPWGQDVPVPRAEVKIVDKDSFNSSDELLKVTCDAQGRFSGRTSEWIDEAFDRPTFRWEARQGAQSSPPRNLGKLETGMRLEVPWGPPSTSTDMALLNSALASLRATHNGGRSGLYLSRNGSVLHASNETLGFDPSSSIKVLVYAQVLRAIEASTGTPSPLDLDTNIFPVMTGPATCPFTVPEASLVFPMKIETAMQKMILDSSNIATEVLRQLAGAGSIDQLISALDMRDTIYRGPPGCARNQTTLADMAKLYTAMAVTPGFLTTMRSKVFELHTWGPMVEIDATVRAHAMMRGLSLTDVENRYRRRVNNIYKRGNGSSGAIDDLNDMSIAGYIGLPSVQPDGTIVMRHYCYGVFADIAQSIAAGANFHTIVALLLAPEIRASVDSFADAGVTI
ncbi:serine hydrolase [Lysobacter brunescens]|uniref:Serine hydrolase n=1 Tax=Lysobacter brunescens TaxID=262323 RepID=A0ABW2YCW3_9GAMM